MKRISAEIKAMDGVPMLMNSWFGIDPKNEIVRKIAELRETPSKKRTEEILDEIDELSWRLSLYYDKELGPYTPAETVEAVIRAGAKIQRKGQQAMASILVEPAQIPIMYDGPRDIDEMYQDPRFIDRRPVKAGTSGGMAMGVRPRFEDWRLSFDIVFMEKQLDTNNIRKFLENAQMKGIGSYRPRFGRFEIVSFEEM